MTWYPLYRKLGGPQDQSGRVWKILRPLGFSPQTIQLVASCYIYYAVTAHLHSTVRVTFMQLLKKWNLTYKTFFRIIYTLNAIYANKIDGGKRVTTAWCFLYLSYSKDVFVSKIIAKNIEHEVLCMIVALLSKYGIEDSSLQGCDAVLLCKWFTTCSFKMSVTTCSVMQLYIPEDGYLRLHCCENLKTYTYGRGWFTTKCFKFIIWFHIPLPVKNVLET